MPDSGRSARYHCIIAHWSKFPLRYRWFLLEVLQNRATQQRFSSEWGKYPFRQFPALTPWISPKVDLPQGNFWHLKLYIKQPCGKDSTCLLIISNIKKVRVFPLLTPPRNGSMIAIQLLSIHLGSVIYLNNRSIQFGVRNIGNLREGAIPPHSRSRILEFFLEEFRWLVLRWVRCPRKSSSRVARKRKKIGLSSPK